MSSLSELLEQQTPEETSRLYELYASDCEQTGTVSTLKDFLLWVEEEYGVLGGVLEPGPIKIEVDYQPTFKRLKFGECQYCHRLTSYWWNYCSLHEHDADLAELEATA